MFEELDNQVITWYAVIWRVEIRAEIGSGKADIYVCLLRYSSSSSNKYGALASKVIPMKYAIMGSRREDRQARPRCYNNHNNNNHNPKRAFHGMKQ